MDKRPDIKHIYSVTLIMHVLCGIAVMHLHPE